MTFYPLASFSLRSTPQPNSNGATSCLSTATGAAVILQAATYTLHQGDNDALGDGNPKGCSSLTYAVSQTTVINSQQAKVG